MPEISVLSGRKKIILITFILNQNNMKRCLLIFAVLFLVSETDAQVLKRLADRAKQKMEQKAISP
jgi:hypothetical protein